MAGGAFGQAATVSVRVDPGIVVARISSDFIGLGYETSAVAQSNYFSGSNVALISLYRNLSAHGLIRIGGNVSDHTKYEAEGVPAVRTERETTVITRANLEALGDFARATGWKVMWGLNLGNGTKEEAVEEALAVKKALGTSLHSLEIGNEVEALPRFKKSYAAYHDAYVEYKSAIRAAWPEAPFSGPDSIGNIQWFTNFAATDSGDVKLLTAHYYRGGAGSPGSTLEKLLQHDDGFDKRLETSRTVASQHGVGYRINEVNSYSGGGKPGVSDTMGGALWCLDYLFVLASHGSEGVNMETDVNQLGFISHYSPIVHESDGRCRARPEYYGMLAFAMAGKGDLVRTEVDAGGANVCAYATKEGVGGLSVVVINKDFSRDAQVRVEPRRKFAKAEVFRLSAPAIDSREDVKFAGSEVDENGRWTPGSPEVAEGKGGVAVLAVPHGTAAVVRVGIE